MMDAITKVVTEAKLTNMVYPVAEVRNVRDEVTSVRVLACFSSKDKAIRFIKEQSYDDEPVFPFLGVIYSDAFDESTGKRVVRINELTVTLMTNGYEVR